MTRSSVPAARTAAARRLAELAALGPYFGVESYSPGEPLCPPWQPLGALTGTLTSPGALAARIGEVRERLAAAAGCPAADVGFRVAASVAQFGLCARLLSPVLGAAAAGWALTVDTARARWVPALGGPFRLSLPEPSLPEPSLPEPSLPEPSLPEPSLPEPLLPEPSLPEPAPGDGSPWDGTAACLSVLAGPVAQITGAVEAMAVSPLVLWGNVASAVNGATVMIAKARPDLAAAAASAAAAALRYPALAGTCRGSPGASFRRRNCCLIYRLSPLGPGRYCGDCVLGPRPG